MAVLYLQTKYHIRYIYVKILLVIAVKRKTTSCYGESWHSTDGYFHFHEDMVPHVILGPCSKWRETWSHFKKIICPPLKRYNSQEIGGHVIGIILNLIIFTSKILQQQTIVWKETTLNIINFFLRVAVFSVILKRLFVILRRNRKCHFLKILCFGMQLASKYFVDQLQWLMLRIKINCRPVARSVGQEHEYYKTILYNNTTILYNNTI